MSAELQGRAIDCYRIQRLLGEGGMGEVYLAWDQSLDRNVAIKLIRPSRLEDQKSQQRFRREARTAAGLSHPSIVQTYRVIESQDTGGEKVDCLVMEHIAGCSLRELIEQERLPLDFAVRIVRQVAEGLEYAHGRGVVHRDLKAENVMLTHDLRAKILDFGLAKRLAAGESSTTGGGGLVGTLYAMAPEQAAGLPVDHRADLFSLGVLAYELFTGRRPFGGETAHQIWLNVMHNPHPPILELAPDLPPELAALVEELLQKNPADRIQNAGLVLARLDPSGDTGIYLLPKRLTLQDLPAGTRSRLEAASTIDHHRTTEVQDQHHTLPAGPVPPSPRVRPRAVLLASLPGALLVALLSWILWPPPFAEKPSSPELLAEAQKVFEAGNDPEAVKNLGRLAAREPWSPGLALLVGRALAGSERFFVDLPSLGLMWVALDGPGESSEDQGRRLQLRARFQIARGGYGEALAAAEAGLGLELAERRRADLQFQKARALDGLGRKDLAVLEVEKARAIYENLADSAGVVECLELRLILDLEAQRSIEAEEAFRAIAAIHQSDPTGIDLAITKINLAMDLSEKGFFEEADRYYAESIATLTRHNMPFELAAAYQGRAINQQLRGRFEAARRDYLEAASNFRLAQNEDRLALVLVNLGELETHLGNLTVAEKHFQESFQVAPQEGAPANTAYFHLQRAELYRRKKDLQAADADLQKAMVFYDAVPPAQRDETYWVARITAARLELARQNFGTAITSARSVLQELRAALAENPILLEKAVVFERASARLMLARTLIEQPSPSAEDVQEAKILLGEILTDPKIQLRPLLLVETRELRDRIP